MNSSTVFRLEDQDADNLAAIFQMSPEQLRRLAQRRDRRTPQAATNGHDPSDSQRRREDHLAYDRIRIYERINRWRLTPPGFLLRFFVERSPQSSQGGAVCGLFGCHDMIEVEEYRVAVPRTVDKPHIRPGTEEKIAAVHSDWS
jgi:hypothetical protein